MKLSTIAALRAGLPLTPVVKHPGHQDQKSHGRGSRGSAAKGPAFKGATVSDWDNNAQVGARAADLESYTDRHAGPNATGERMDTEHLYKRADGSYTAKRAAQHDEIVDELMAKNAHVPNEGKAVVIAGPPGAGKTSILKAKENGSAEAVGVEFDAKGSLKSHAGENADDIKIMMTEKGMTPKIAGAVDGEMVSLVHEESSHISKMYNKRLVAEKKNIVIDGTMGGDDAQKQVDKIHAVQGRGYDVKGIMVDTDPEMAIASATGRWVGGEKSRLAKPGEKPHESTSPGGRYVPASVTRASSMPTGRVPGAKPANRENFEILTRPGSGVDFSEVLVFDNSKTAAHPGGYGNVLVSHRIKGREMVAAPGTGVQVLGAPSVMTTLPGTRTGRRTTGATESQGGLTGPMFAKDTKVVVGKRADGTYVFVKHKGHQDQKSHGRKATFSGESAGRRQGGAGAAINSKNAGGLTATAQSRRVLAGEANSPKTGKPISEDAQSAHAAYSNSTISNDMNKKLRTRNENLTPDERKVQGGMDKAFNEASFELDAPRTVHRSEMKRVGGGATGDAADLVVGRKVKTNDVTVDHGFMSTRENRSDATGDMDTMSRSDFGRGVQVNYAITAPAGTRMVAGSAGQGETIIDRGSALRVTRVTKTGPNTVDVEAEVFTGRAAGGGRVDARTPRPVTGRPTRTFRTGTVPGDVSYTGKSEGDAGSALPKVLTVAADLRNLVSEVSISLRGLTGILKHPGHADQKSHGRKRRSGQSAQGELLGETIPASEGDVHGFTTANYPSQALGYTQQKKQMMKEAPPTEADKKRLAEENKYTERLGVPPQTETDKQKLAKTHDSYIGSGHAGINGDLRDPDGPMSSRADAAGGGGVGAMQIDRMDQAFSQDNMGVELTRDAKLYRGVQAERSIDAHPMSKLEAGDEFTDLGFTSTSTNTAVTRDFIDRDARGESEGIQFNITAPAGTTVIGGMDAEQELILPRGSKFRVTGKTRLQGQDEDDPDTWMGTESGRPVFDEYNENWSGGSKDILVVNVELTHSKPLYKTLSFFKHPGHQDQKSHGRRGTSEGNLGGHTTASLATQALGYSRAKNTLMRNRDEPENVDGVVNDYTQGGHRNINQTLRDRSAPMTGAADWGDGPRPPYGDEGIDLMDQAFSQKNMGVELSGEAVLYRGVMAKEGRGIDDHSASKLEVGDEFTDLGFTSTTNSQGVAANFVNAGPTGPGREGIEFTIKTPPGTTVIGGMVSEQELILPRGSRFKVTGTNRETEVDRLLSGSDSYKKDVLKVTVELIESKPLYKMISLFKHKGHQDQKSHGRRGSSSGGGSKATNGDDAISASSKKKRSSDLAVQSQQSEYVRGNYINQQLRNPEKYGEPPPGALDDMDRAFSSEQMGVQTGPIMVARGAGFDQGSASAKMFEDMKEGDEFKDSGFVSTTTITSDIQERFLVGSGTQVETFVSLKDGQTVIAGSGVEREIILPRNSTFKVTQKNVATRSVTPDPKVVGVYDRNNPATFTPTEQKKITLYVEVVDAPTVYKSVSFFKHPGHADQKSHGRRSASRVQAYKKELAQRAFGEGGGTWDWRNEKFVDDGKIVALDAYEGRYKPPTGGWTEDAVADSIVDWSSSPDVKRGLRSRTDANVGMWLDDDSGDLFLDVSIKLTGATPAKANRLAKRENQLAWWDGDNQQLWVGDGAGNYNPT